MDYRFIGDSNFRDLFSQFKDEISAASSTVLEFELATSVASIKTILDNPDYKPGVVFIASPTNEIALKSKNNTKSREGIIETVVTDLFNCVNDHANKHDNAIYVVCQPFLRKDPPWLEPKIQFYKDFIKTIHAKTTRGNVFVGGEIMITSDDLKPDQIHLNEKGMLKLRTGIISDLKTAKEHEAQGGGGGGEGFDEEMDEAPLSHLHRNAKKTPLRNKRAIEESDEEEGRVTRKRKQKKIS